MHHISPTIHHCHYPELNDKFNKLCNKYNVKRNIEITFIDALKNHFNWLKNINDINEIKK